MFNMECMTCRFIGVKDNEFICKNSTKGMDGVHDLSRCKEHIYNDETLEHVYSCNKYYYNQEYVAEVKATKEYEEFVKNIK